MAQKSKVAAFRMDLANQIKWICNHLYWYVYSITDQNEREARWAFLVDHLIDRHNNCFHSPLVGQEKWITKGQQLQWQLQCSNERNSKWNCSDRLLLIRSTFLILQLLLIVDSKLHVYLLGLLLEKKVYKRHEDTCELESFLF